MIKLKNVSDIDLTGIDWQYITKILSLQEKSENVYELHFLPISRRYGQRECTQHSKFKWKSLWRAVLKHVKLGYCSIFEASFGMS